jgi:hypothetical protein
VQSGIASGGVQPAGTVPLGDLHVTTHVFQSPREVADLFPIAVFREQDPLTGDEVEIGAAPDSRLQHVA